MTAFQTPVSQDMPHFPAEQWTARLLEAGSLLGDEVQWTSALAAPKTTPSSRSRQPRGPTGMREFLREMGRRQQAEDDVRNARLAMAWISENTQRYAGRWVALRGNFLLAEGDTAAAVYAQVANLADPPFVVKLEVNDQRPFAGW